MRYALVDNALIEFQKLEKLAPEDKEVLNGIAHCYYLNGQHHKAKLYFDKMPKKFPHRRGIATTYALTIHMSGDTKLAMSVLKLARDENSVRNNKRYAEVEGFVQDELDKQEKARIAAEEKAKKEAEDKAKKEIEDKEKKEAEDKAKKEADDKAKQEVKSTEATNSSDTKE